jgi:hypothetical protein
MAETGTQPSMADSALTWVLENKLRAVFYTWATGVGGSLVSAALFGACPFCHHCALARTVCCSHWAWSPCGPPVPVGLCTRRCSTGAAAFSATAAVTDCPAAPHAPRLLLVQAFQWSRPIPTSLKIIHSRVYAQAITLAALGAVAGVEMYAASDANIKPASRHGDY